MIIKHFPMDRESGILTLNRGESQYVGVMRTIFHTQFHSNSIRNSKKMFDNLTTLLKKIYGSPSSFCVITKTGIFVFISAQHITANVPEKQMKVYPC